MSHTTTTICITGATGNVGLETLRAVHSMIEYSATENGTTARIVAASQSPMDAARTIGLDNIEYRALDMTNTDATHHAAAFKDIEVLFLMRPPQISDVQTYIAPLVASAERAGVRHVVFLSLYGVESQTRTPHYAIEQLLRQSRIKWTFLRPSFFMQNLTTTHREEIAQRNEIFVPAGDGKTNFIDARDIGAAAATVLLNPEHHINSAYNLTGRHSYTYNEIAAILSKELGRTIRYTNPSKLRFFWRKAVQERVPVMFVLVMLYLYHQTVAGKADGYAPDLERLLGREPVSFEDFVRRNKTVWLQDGR